MEQIGFKNQPDALRRKFIADTIKFYKEHYPLEYQKAIQHAKVVRGTRANVFGSDKQLEWRHEFTFPKELYRVLDNSLGNPRFLKDNKEAEWFRRTFPEFAAHEKW